MLPRGDWREASPLTCAARIYRRRATRADPGHAGRPRICRGWPDRNADRRRSWRATGARLHPRLPARLLLAAAPRRRSRLPPLPPPLRIGARRKFDLDDGAVTAERLARAQDSVRV